MGFANTLYSRILSYLRLSMTVLKYEYAFVKYDGSKGKYAHIWLSSCDFPVLNVTQSCRIQQNYTSVDLALHLRNYPIRIPVLKSRMGETEFFLQM